MDAYRLFIASAAGLTLAACAPTPPPATDTAPSAVPSVSAQAPTPPAQGQRVDPPFAGLVTNETIVNLIKDEEGLRLEAYQGTTNGPWLIGYGHTGDDVTPGLRITEAKADELLRNDLRAIEASVKSAITVPLNRDELSALVDLVYNIGSGNFRTSTVRTELNAGDRAAAAEAFLLWDKVTVNGQRVVSPVLAERRQRERAMFLGEDD